MPQNDLQYSMETVSSTSNSSSRNVARPAQSRDAMLARPKWLRRFSRRHKRILTGVMIFLVVSLLFLLPFFFTPAQKYSSSNYLNFGRVSSNSPLHGAPFDGLLTAGVVPKRIHSHNDYTRTTPLFEAISLGVPSVEADVWLINGNLLVGHSNKGLSADRTLSSLYLEPIKSLLDHCKSINNGTKRGIFDVAPTLPLTLYIDFKSDGTSTFPVVNQTLSALRDAGYLTTYNANQGSSPPQYSQLTIIATGNAPLSMIQALNPRDIFYDAPLDDIGNNAYQPSLSPIANGAFKKLIGASWLPGGKGKGKIANLIQQAHAKGIQTRFWGTPTIPVWARNRVWSILLEAGTDWLNVDDLPAAVAF
ncbi:hypothetical protein DL96DRAFT_1211087 [Flagelloscypha sp. PMI_526]|nr:hypothetical protein DL96DRAFT_1211087 [Flagelloscypha sp. PMI_526]